MNHKQQTFVTEYLRHRDAMTAYSIAYNYETSNYASLQSLANRLMNHPEVSATIHSILDGIRHDVEQEIRAELKVELLTVQRKREILAKIAVGEFYAVHNYKGKDCSMCSQHVWPTINQVLKAIDLDNKMAGLYSVDKRQATPYPPKGETKAAIAQQTTTIQETEKVPSEVGVQQTTTNLVAPFREDRRASRENNKSQQFSTNQENAPSEVGVQQIIKQNYPC